MNLTTNSSETTLLDLMDDNCIFSIPYFQRPYRFSAELMKKLMADLADLLDSGSESHFFGAIITNRVPGGMSDPKVYQVIDGQQRITTAYLLVCGAVQSLIAEKEFEAAKDLFETYIVVTGNTKSLSNIALHTGRAERAALNEIVKGLIDSGGFKFDIKLLPSTTATASRSRIVQNYKLVNSFYKQQRTGVPGGAQRVSDLCSSLLNGFRLIEINVTDPTNGPKIFDRLNSGQSPMTIGDLVRNDVFSRGDVSSPAEIEKLDMQVWQPFYGKFEVGEKHYFDDYLFPFGIVQGPKWKKSEVYDKLRTSWKGQPPTDVIESLKEYQDDFLDLVQGTNTCAHGAPIAAGLERLYRANRPGSTLPFLMRLSREVRLAAADPSKGELVELTGELLDYLESFLVRRAVCGIEPTGLHAVFRGLWDNLDGDYTGANFRAVLAAKHKTVSWPDDEQFALQIRTRALYDTGILRFVLQELESEGPGDTSERDDFTVEHVLPQTYSDKKKAFTDSWGKLYSKDEHEACVHTLANLIPISGPMNESLSQAPYDKKRATYLIGSKFALARKFGSEYATWTPEDLQSRADSLGTWAVSRWRY